MVVESKPLGFDRLNPIDAIHSNFVKFLNSVKSEWIDIWKKYVFPKLTKLQSRSKKRNWKSPDLSDLTRLTNFPFIFQLVNFVNSVKFEWVSLLQSSSQTPFLMYFWQFGQFCQICVKLTKLTKLQGGGGIKNIQFSSQPL